MATFSIGGLASGLDTEGLIQKLLAVERRPLGLLEARRRRLESVSNALGELAAKLDTLRARAAALGDARTFMARTAASSNPTVATATASSGDLRGTFTLTVTALARGSLATGTTTVGDPTDPVAAGEGTFTFRVGTADPVSLPLTAATSLGDLVSAINASGRGVRAMAVNLGTAESPAWTLTLASSATGAASTITILDDGTTLGVTTTQTGADAVFSLAGVGTFTRPGNTVADVLGGVTLTLRGLGETAITLGVDGDGIAQAIQGLVDAYNDVVRTIAAQSRTTQAARGELTQGPLAGDGVIRALQLGLAGAVATQSAGTYRSLAELGITTRRDGTLTVEGARLRQALDADPDAVRDLLAGTLTADGVADAVAARARAAAAPITGGLTVRREALAESLRQLDRQIAAAEDRLARTEDLLRARFAALEQAIARTQQTSTFLAGQLALLERGRS
jgi:flagellar hook-associated protein 2